MFSGLTLKSIEVSNITNKVIDKRNLVDLRKLLYRYYSSSEVKSIALLFFERFFNKSRVRSLDGFRF